MEDDSDGTHTLQNEDNLSLTRDYTNCLFITARNIQQLGSVFFVEIAHVGSYKICEIYLSDKMYESLHGKNFFIAVVKS